MTRNPVAYFLAGVLAFTLAGFGLPGPQGASGGASAISDLSDVDTTGVNDGEVLTYVTANGQWEPAASSGGSFADDELLTLGTGNDSKFEYSTDQTNPGTMWWLDGTGGSEAIIFADSGNEGLDYGFSDVNRPTLIVTSEEAWGTDATEYCMWYVDSTGNAYWNTGATDHGFIWKPGNQERLRINSSGNTQLFNGYDLVLQSSGGQDTFLSGAAGGRLYVGATDSEDDGQIYLAEVVFENDPNTYIQGGVSHTLDQIDFFAGGVNLLSVVESTTDYVAIKETGGDELQLSHDGTDAKLESTAGGIHVLPGGNNQYQFNNGELLIDSASMRITGGGSVGWDDDADGTSESRAVGHVVSLTDGVATSVLELAVAAGETVSGELTIKVVGTDGTDQTTDAWSFGFVATNKSGTITTATYGSAVASADTGGGTQSVSTGLDTGTADTLKVTINANSTLTSPTITCTYQAVVNTVSTVTLP